MRGFYESGSGSQILDTDCVLRGAVNKMRCFVGFGGFDYVSLFEI